MFCSLTLLLLHLTLGYRQKGRHGAAAVRCQRRQADQHCVDAIGQEYTESINQLQVSAVSQSQ